MNIKRLSKQTVRVKI